MSVLSMLDEINNIAELVAAYESLNSLQYAAAAEHAMEALKSQIATLKLCLEEVAK